MPFVTRKSLLSLFLLVIGALVLIVGFVWSGLYNVGADDPHTRPMLVMMEALRERSIHVRSKDIDVPRLDEPQLILKGAGQYAAMCTGCHLAPGMQESEIRPGLYPQPPDLSKLHVDPREAFWVIKHGVKMSGMPAWGGSHDDPTIWSMVAFLQKLPTLTPEQYRDLVAKAPPDAEMEGGHHHHHGAAEEEQNASEHETDVAGKHEDAGSHHHDASAASQESATESHTHDDAAGAAIEGYSAKAVPGAEAVAAAFHAALQGGDRQQVLALLAPDVRISEGGETQDRATYAAGHLGEDLSFLGTATVHPLFTGSMPMGKTAMVASRSEIHASAKSQALTLLSTEILTLKNTGKGWLITRIDWSSERRP